jgi:hypothetical protein
MAPRKLNEKRTSGPEGHTIRPVNVRAKARTYPTAGFSATCLAAARAKPARNASWEASLSNPRIF